MNKISTTEYSLAASYRLPMVTEEMVSQDLAAAYRSALIAEDNAVTDMYAAACAHATAKAAYKAAIANVKRIARAHRAQRDRELRA